jgi:hypothetical protein
MRTYTEDDLRKMFEAGVAEGLALLENALLAHGFSVETVTRALAEAGEERQKKKTEDFKRVFAAILKGEAKN